MNATLSDLPRLPPRPARVVSPVTLIVAVLIGVWVAGRTPAAAQSAASDTGTAARLIILFDTSGSMGYRTETRPGTMVGGRINSISTATGPRRLDLAVEWMTAEVRAHLLAGGSVRVYTFNRTLDFRPNNEWPRPGSAAVGIDEQLVEIRRLVTDTTPGGDTAIWGSIEQLIPVLPDDALTSVAIYTDDEDNASAAGAREHVEAELAKRFSRTVAEGSGIKMRVWRPNSVAPVLPPSARVRLLSTQLPILAASAFAGGGTADVTVDVKAVFAGRLGPGDKVDAPRVVLRGVGDAVPPVTVVGADLDHPLTSAAPDGKLRLRFKAAIPPGVVRYEYDVRADFDFTSDLPGLVPADRRQAITSGQTLRLVVASKPTVQLSVTPHALEDLWPGRSRDVAVTVRGNADATGGSCKLFATAIPQGVTVKFLPLDEQNAPREDAAAAELLFPLKASDQSVPAVCRVTGVAAGEGALQISALVSGVSAAEPLRVKVLQPVVSAKLLRPTDKTQLSTEGDAATRPFERLTAGPLSIDAKSFPVDAKLVIEVQAGQEDVDIGLGDANAKRVEINPSQVTSVTVSARWRRFPDARTEATVPALRLSVEGVPGVKLLTPTVPLDGLFDVGQPTIALTLADNGSGKTDPATGQARFAPDRVRAGRRLTRRVQLNWNPAASGASVRVTPASLPGGGTPVVQAVNGVGAPPWSTLGADNLLRLPDAANDRRFGDVAIDVTAPAAAQPMADAHVTFQLIDKAGNPAGKPWAVTIPFEVVPIVFTVKLDQGNAPVRAFLGAALPLMTVTANGEGGVTGTVRLALGSVDETSAAPITFGQNQTTLDVDVPADRTVAKPLVLQPVAAVAKAGRPAKVRLTVQAISEEPDARVRLNGSDAAQATASIDIDLAIESWSLAAFYNGETCTKIPPRSDAIMINKGGETWQTAALPRPFELKLVGGMELTDQAKALPLTATVLRDDAKSEPGISDVGFELNVEGDKPKVVPSITMGDLKSLRGLVVRTPGGLMPRPFDEQVFNGKVRLEVPDLGIALVLPYKVRLSANMPWWVYAVGIGGALLLLGLAAWLIFGSKSPEREAVVTDNGPIDGDLFEASRSGYSDAGMFDEAPPTPPAAVATPTAKKPPADAPREASQTQQSPPPPPPASGPVDDEFNF